MKHLRIPLLILLGCAGFAVYYLVNGDTAASTSQANSAEPIISSEAFHITKRDGTKSIAQLIREQSTGTPTPDLPLKSFHFIVDGDHDALILERTPGAQPEGFQIAIRPGTDLKFTVSKLPLNAPEALELFPLRTKGVTNVLILMEFYPR
jgi:hypothetical protein